MREATINLGLRANELLISIHASREGGDYRARTIKAGDILISIHASREGGDPPTPSRDRSEGEDFNPRLP